MNPIKAIASDMNKNGMKGGTKESFIINASTFTGGTGTLSLRIAQFLVSHQYRVIYLYTRLNDDDNHRELLRLGVDISQFSEFSFKSLISSNTQQRFYTISYSFDRYLAICLKTQSYRNLINLLYIVHPYNFISMNTDHYLRNNVFRFIFGSLFKKMLLGNLLVFMDNNCVQVFQQNYPQLVLYQPKVFYLPYSISPNNRDIDEVTYHHSILTILRAEFPFKGYVFGLIEQFGSLIDKFPKLKLRVISFGEQENQLLDSIADLPESVRNNIEYLGRVSYEDLSQWFDKTDLYIGMGTTLLDAANNYVPALVIESYTYECKTAGYFSDNPSELSAHGDVLVPVSKLIEEFYAKSDEEILQLRHESFQALKDNYSIETFFGGLFDLFEQSTPIHLSLKEKIGVFPYFAYGKFRRRISNR